LLDVDFAAVDFAVGMRCHGVIQNISRRKIMCGCWLSKYVRSNKACLLLLFFTKKDPTKLVEISKMTTTNIPKPQLKTHIPKPQLKSPNKDQQ